MRARLIRWAVLAVAVPVAAAAVRKIADEVEKNRGPQSKLANGLRKVGDAVNLGR